MAVSKINNLLAKGSFYLCYISKIKCVTKSTKSVLLVDCQDTGVFSQYRLPGMKNAILPNTSVWSLAVLLMIMWSLIVSMRNRNGRLYGENQNRYEVVAYSIIFIPSPGLPSSCWLFITASARNRWQTNIEVLLDRCIRRAQSPRNRVLVWKSGCGWWSCELLCHS